MEKAAREDGLFNEVNDVMHMHEFEDIPHLWYTTSHKSLLEKFKMVVVISVHIVLFHILEGLFVHVNWKV